MDEFIDGVQHGDIAKVAEYVGYIQDNPHSPAFVYAIRYAIGINDMQLFTYLLSAIDCDDYVFDTDTIIASIMSENVEYFTRLIGKDGVGLQTKVIPKKHPLVVAARVGNMAVVKQIVDWVRKDNNIRFISDPALVKYLTLKMAARGGYVAIANLLIINKEQAHGVVIELIANGHIDKVKRFAISDKVDFSANNFELLRLCAPYPLVLNCIMRHPSMVKIKDNMPTEYSRIAMTAAEDNHLSTVDMIEKSFKRNLNMYALSNVNKTSCSTTAAVDKAFNQLYISHKEHTNQGSFTNFSF